MGLPASDMDLSRKAGVKTEPQPVWVGGGPGRTSHVAPWVSVGLGDWLAELAELQTSWLGFLTSWDRTK